MTAVHRMQGSFIAKKAINVKDDINKLKRKNHVTVSIYAEKSIL